MAAILMTLNDLQGHSRIANSFKWDLAYCSAAVEKISTGSTSHGPSAIATVSLLVF